MHTTSAQASTDGEMVLGPDILATVSWCLSEESKLQHSRLPQSCENQRRNIWRGKPKSLKEVILSSEV